MVKRQVPVSIQTDTWTSQHTKHTQKMLMSCWSLFLVMVLWFVSVLQTWSFFVGNGCPYPTSLRYTQQRCQMSMDFDWSGTKKKADVAMKKASDSLLSTLSTVRATGNNAAILDRVFVNVMGSSMPLNQIARVSGMAQQLIIEPFDSNMCQDIVKAIRQSPTLNLNPVDDGSGKIRVNLPPLTEDRRKELCKQVKSLCEDCKVSVRNSRRDFVEKVKSAEKVKDIDKDTSKFYQDDLQKLTDSHMKNIDNILKAKEKDLLTV